MHNVIQVHGAREHNLKNIDIQIPRDQIVVITGVSGSGKSSLAFDTLYAEGQMRYVESLSSYARQFLGQVNKPDVDSIEGLSPAIAIEQKTTSNNPRSTVGTVTEIYDYLRLLWARAGTPHCPTCKGEVTRQSVDQIVDQIYKQPEGTKYMVLAPIVHDKKGEHQHIFEQAKLNGYARVRVDGIIMNLSEPIQLDKKRKHTIAIVVDRLVVKEGDSQRLTDSLEIAISLSGDTVVIHLMDRGEDLLFSQSFACPHCGFSLPELTPSMFSFNNQYGACPTCSGLGFHLQVDPGRLTPDLSPTQAERIGKEIEGNMSALPCQDCHGDRLAPMLLAVTVSDLNIAEYCKLSITEGIQFIQKMNLSPAKAQIAAPIVTEIVDRLVFMEKVGLEYLTLSRTAGTLSGGESQRIRLATQIGSRLTGVLYILDEPSIGLHQRDNERLLSALTEMRDLGNSVIVVEHDEDTMRHADWIIDVGPGAGINGGEVVAQGTLEQIISEQRSLTGQYLSYQKWISVPESRRPGNGHHLTIIGAAENNLKDITVSIPLGTITCVTGVSGSGKSSLVNEILYKKLASTLHRAHTRAGKHEQMDGIQHLDKVISIDQSPIGRTPRSNPATYTGLFDNIRSLFAMTNEAKVRAYGPGRFSFNIRGGRCEACTGDGLMRIGMHFLPDVYVPCDICKGKRYNRETLEVRYKGKSIADILEMTADEAVVFFENVPKIRKKIEALCKVGLGYVQLGQASTTLSGGEAQRVKLASELLKPATGSTLYVMDEPTTGLHIADVQQLIHILHVLADEGNTVVVIEHNLDVIKNADYLIDLGPEGGSNGGNILCTGTPEQVADFEANYTGQYLRRELRKSHDAMKGHVLN
ncbi:excinuclease ABC subunit UvrA [Paenibacillus sp. LS1]|uniref:excinuclease ABC subunit UvrA n=1 Tax=Paenibacillus sp. LS1 TaxID=2992120 RepID=UPI00223262DF|nr:excinuclease ABC subunit UvrA [Paenibacillus sp. LS1]MCW3794828.1 excinuclease ABC subunit UvrA [Paenibacillus sp. LS1]